MRDQMSKLEKETNCEYKIDDPLIQRSRQEGILCDQLTSDVSLCQSFIYFQTNNIFQLGFKTMGQKISGSFNKKDYESCYSEGKIWRRRSITEANVYAE